ncbi:MAG: sulfotransferase family protein [Gammaproteobacteria bacterium]|nr:sulfotransferase family protein [Gammaproteobacteria bacterium]
MSLELIGAGFGRTGTMGLKLALDQLGWGPCYHMMEVSQNAGHAEMWRTATQSGQCDWAELFANYRSCVDWPASAFWETLLARYPTAKVLLTVRDPEDWYRSMSNTIYQRMMTARENGSNDARSQMAYELILNQTFKGRFTDKSFAIDVFNAHVAQVKAKAPAAQLLVLETGSGWEPLCEFLNVPVPDVPYPHVNKTEEFRERFGMSG